jgi:serine/threonine-protein kinase
MSDQRDSTSERWLRVKEVFSAALERAPAARAAFLDEACGAGDALVRREVEALLAAHQASDRFLETPAAAVAPPTPSHRELAEGQTLGPYRVVRVLGHGGMATVYLARDERHRRSVALKILQPELAHALGPERFLREIEVAANLSHPHILPLHDSGEAAGLLYYVMPYVEGESLRDRLRRETQLPVDEALQLAREVADALAYAHGQGVIHRDIKPENILLSGGHALVADFGIARVLGQAGSAHLTETGMAIGTAAYMSPEQASAASHIDGRSDVYSLGCVVYEMLAGEPPYTGPTPQAIIAKRFSDPVPSVRRVRPTVPQALDRLVIKALATVPADRPATAAEFARALAAATASPSTTAPASAVAARTTAVRPGWRTLTVIVAATIGVVMIAIAALLAKQRTPSRALDPNVVAVAPFRVSSADPSLGYLREGMVDLLAAKLTGEGGPRAADPRAVLSGWRGASRSDAGDLPQDAALKVAERLGAGQLLVGTVVGAPGRIVLNASVLAVPGGQTRAQASLEGPTDSLHTLVDQLAAKLLTLGAGEGEQRLASLASASFPALRAYLDGQAMYRRGRYAEAVTQFRKALEFDSTFALAALGLLAGGNRTGEYEAVYRGEELAWASRARLNPRDLAYLVALIGQGYSDTTSYAQLLRSTERFVEVAPDRAEAWTALGDALFYYGEMLGKPTAHGRAASAYRRAIELDPTFAPAVDQLAIVAARAGDTATIWRLAGFYRRNNSAGQPVAVVRWRIAIALDDSSALQRIRAKFGEMLPDELVLIGQLSQYDGVALEDAQRAQAAMQARESRLPYRRAILAEVGALALNRGRPAEALKARQAEQELNPDGSYPILSEIVDALYWDGDSAAGAAAVRALERGVSRPGVPSSGPEDRDCYVEQWRLAHGQLDGARAAIARLRGKAPGPGVSSGLALFSKGCSILLEALLASAEKRADLDDRIARLDSLMLTGPPYRGYDQWWNLVIAQLKEGRGDRQGALAATRRRLYFQAEPLFLSTYLREEGRLAALTGDRAGAIRAYQHYLALRANPEPALRPQVEQVQAELGRLLSEPTR